MPESLPTAAPTRVVVLGSTGSIGTQTLEVARHAPDRFRIVALAAGGSDLTLLAEQAIAHRVEVVAVARAEARGELVGRLTAGWPADVSPPEVMAGPHALTEVAAWEADVVLNAVDGHQGLPATVAALASGHRLALANKESLVAGGRLVTGLAQPGQIVPVDSEHSALAQCLRGGSRDEVQRLVLTASGGPFRGWSRRQLTDVTPQQAAAHPTWSMGPLVTTNSATLVNKGLELIEAHLLFDVPYEQIEVVVHPQSIVHSMVEFTDGSTIAQASPPDMRLTISLALGWPGRVPGAAKGLDWRSATAWTFEPVDEQTFPAIRLAREAGMAGGCAPAVFNAANEELVAAFGRGRLGFLDISARIEKVLGDWLATEHAAGAPGTVEQIESAQNWARHRARSSLVE